MSMVPPRPMPHLIPEYQQASKPKSDKPYKMPRMSKKELKKKRAHDQIEAAFLANNKICDCGECGQPSDDPHHICGGTFAKDASRFDTDLQLAVARWCHDTKFSDKLAYPVELQLALKIAAILRKANRYRGRGAKAITMKSVLKYLDLEE